MKPLFGTDEVKALEAHAALRGMPSSLLMENAGAALARTALRLASEEGRFFVVCGPGNNGGDGLVAARKLAELGRCVQVEVVGGTSGLRGEPERNLRALTLVKLSVHVIQTDAPHSGDVVLDALFGTGLNRAPEGDAAEAIRRIHKWRAQGAQVVAADVPSGLQSDSGHAFDPAVQADVTVSFGVWKRGIALDAGPDASGEVEVVDIGLGTSAQEPTTWLLEPSDVLGWIPKRKTEGHKGSYGHLLLIAGSRGKSGAAAMAALAALRAGVGLVTVATRLDALDAVLCHAPELMGFSLDRTGPLTLDDWPALASVFEGKRALVVGPGIPRGEGTRALLERILEHAPGPCLLDADALNVVSEAPEVLKHAKWPVVLTPHPGEMARLVRTSTEEVQKNRLALAREFATTHGVTLVLKGARTLIALADGNVRINPTGNPGMGTGGTGDVLSGIIGALLAQGLPAADAASAGVYLHGLAGDQMARVHGQAGLIATDLLEGLTRVWAKWDR